MLYIDPTTSRDRMKLLNVLLGELKNDSQKLKQKIESQTRIDQTINSTRGSKSLTPDKLRLASMQNKEVTAQSSSLLEKLLAAKQYLKSMIKGE